MPSYSTLLNDWGDAGTEPVAGWNWAKDEPVPAEWQNWVFDNIIKDIKHLVDITEANGGLKVADADKVDGKDADELGGFDYVQTGEPGSNASGSTWFNDVTDLLYVGDASTYEPVAELNKWSATNFTESWATVTHESPTPRTELNAGSLRLIPETVVSDFEDGTAPETDDWTYTGDTGNLSAQGTTVLTGSQSGELVAASVDTSVTLAHDNYVAQDVEFKVQIENDTANASDFTEIQFWNDDGTTKLGYIKFNDGAGNVVWSDTSSDTELQGSWTLGTTYDFEVDPDFANGQADVTLDGSTTTVPLATSTALGFTSVVFRNNTSNAAVTRSLFLDDVRTGARETGEVVVSFDAPVGTIESWNALRWDETLDSETITVDVEDSADDSTLIAGVSDYEDLSGIGTGVTPQFRFKLSRASTANNPTVDSVEESWTHAPGDSLPKSGGTMIGDINLEGVSLVDTGSSDTLYDGSTNEWSRTVPLAAMTDETGAPSNYNASDTSSSGWVTVANVSGEGYLINGHGWQSYAESGVQWRITVDGTEYTIDAIPEEYNGDSDITHTAPPITKYYSSLKVEFRTSSANQWGVEVFII